MSLKEAMKSMRELTERNVPFSFGFITCNTSTETSSGYKVVKNAMLRKGYSKAHSSKHNILISYTDLDTDDNRQCYLPLIVMFNGTKLN